MSLSPTGHLLHKATPPRLGDISDQPNTQKPIQRGSQTGRQRNMPQIKEQKKSPEKELNKMETNYLPDTGFKIMVIGMFKALRGKMGELSKHFNKEIVPIKRDTQNTK